MIDGMNMNDPSTSNGAIDFAHLLTDNLDRIEVVRGPMSTLYGSGAIGGVINMVTKKGAGALSGGGYAEIGTRLQTSAGAYVRGSAERFNYNISATGLYAQGESFVPPRFTPQGAYVDLDAYRNINLASRLGFDLNDNSQFTWFSRFIDTQVKYDQVAMEDPNAIEFTQQFFNRLQFDGNYFNGLWKPRRWASATARSIGTTWTTSSLAVPAGFFFSPSPNSTFSGFRTFTADWKNVSSRSATCSTSWAASTTTGSGPTPIRTSIISFPCSIPWWRTGAPAFRRPASTASSAALCSTP